MKSRLILMLLICAILLAGCYRQSEEPFQQIDSAEVVAEATAAVFLADDESGDAAADDGSGGGALTTAGDYITPETVPGQVDQPTFVLLTSAVGAPPTATLAPFVRPTATLTFAEQLDPNDECVYQVRAGNVLFRLALAWGTTYQTIMEVNQLESEDLSIGQLLLIPGCEPSVPEAALSEAPVATVARDSSPEAEATALPPAEIETVAASKPEIHVVSAGETIESISLRYRVDVNELIALNEITNRNRLNVGQELKLPQS